MLNCHYSELTLDYIAEFRIQSTLEEPEEPEPEPEPEPHPESKEKTMTISSLTEGLGTKESGIKVFEDIDSKE